jgi:hypothetical protein
MKSFAGRMSYFPPSSVHFVLEIIIDYVWCFSPKWVATPEWQVDDRVAIHHLGRQYAVSSSFGGLAWRWVGICNSSGVNRMWSFWCLRLWHVMHFPTTLKLERVGNFCNWWAILMMSISRHGPFVYSEVTANVLFILFHLKLIQYFPFPSKYKQWTGRYAPIGWTFPH